VTQVEDHLSSKLIRPLVQTPVLPKKKKSFSLLELSFVEVLGINHMLDECSTTELHLQNTASIF
jgi:hypothetical protein